jgi:hypothetical protein
MLKDFEKHYPNTKTTELLKMLNTLRCFKEKYNTNVFITEKISSKLYIIINAIKKELAKREHIPNKKERKTIRQLKYKSQLNK